MIRLIVAMILPIFAAVYTFSFGIYNWRQGNKLGGIGVIFLALGSVCIPLLMLLIKN